MCSHRQYISAFTLWLLIAAAQLSITPCAAQNQHLDSLKKYINNQNTNDRNKLKAIIELAGKLATKDFDASYKYGNEGLQIAGKLKDSMAIGQLLNEIGEASYFKGQYDIAARHFYQSVAVLEKIGDSKQLALSFNNLAKLYRKTGELDKAGMYYNRAMNLYKKAADTAGIQMIWNEWGVIFEYKGLYDTAIQYYSKSAEIALQRNDSLGLGYAYNNIAGAYVLEKKYDTATAYLQKCIAIRQQMKDSFALAASYSDMGNLLTEKGDYNNAIASIETSNSIAQRMEYPDLQLFNYKQLASISALKGDYKQAYLFQQKASTLRDSIYTLDKDKQIAELNTKYETEKKEQQIQLQSITISRKNYILAGVIAVMLLGVALAYSYYRRYKLKQEKKLQDEIMHQQYKATQAVLAAEERERERIGQDLHDGIGQIMSAVKINLSVMQSELPMKTEDERIRFDNLISLVDESCKEVRSVSHNMMPNALLKAGLASAIRDFINKIDSKILEANLYTEGLNERMDTNTETVLYRVIQECVNNVIKHAFATRIDIAIIKDEEGISITIEDNGVGFDTTNTNIYEGIGLKNILTRIAYLKGTVDFDSRPGKGTVIMIDVPA